MKIHFAALQRRAALPGFFAVLLLVAACGSQKRAANVQTWRDYFDEIDTAAAYYDDDTDDAARNAYAEQPLQETYSLVNDLVHTRLDVRFDWQKERLLGKAWLTLSPRFYDTDSLRLDAKGMFIHKLELVGASTRPLLYAYDDSLELRIALDRTYKASERYTVYIEYTARPSERKTQGSAAITDAKGLYFINAANTDATRPRQLWTQGETESNSAWFPTIDKPNAKTTLEISMTVDTGLVTLSNGLMTASKRNNDGTRTDTWKLDKPFAPYLVMMTVGKFSVVKDRWRNMPVDYYVDPTYAPHARAVFGNTPEMLTFFSRIFGIDYPWPKYAQVVVHDFVSGAMENVTASVFYDRLHATTRELLDENHDDIIAHELAHHWFGNLVTCESWSHLSLNEAFATYAEVLWMQHKYGPDEAAHHAHNDLTGYLGEAEMKQVPIVRFRFRHPDDMFDAHSYQKGSRVLLMLHSLLGDAAFFQSLRLYLDTHRYGAAEMEDLRRAVEAVTGRDMKWFFDQWFHQAGHPVVTVHTQYQPAANAVLVHLRQTPSTPHNAPAHWRLPMAIDLHFAGGRQRHHVVFDSLRQVFVLPAYEAPLLVKVDADNVLLWQKEEGKPLSDYAHQYRVGNYVDRYEAIQQFAGNQGLDSIATHSLIAALDDPFWRMRQHAVDAIDMSDGMTPLVRPKLEQLARRDERSAVRASALIKLAQTGDTSLAVLFVNALRDSSYMVMAQGLTGLFALDANRAHGEAKNLMSETNASVAGAVMYVLAESRDTALHDFFADRVRRAGGGDRFSALMTYGRFLAALPFDNAQRHLALLYEMAAGEPQWFVRYAAISALFDVRNAWDHEAGNLGIEMNAMSPDDPAYHQHARAVQARRAAIAEMDRRVAELRRNETNEMLRSLMGG